MTNNLLSFDPPSKTVVTMSSYQMAELTQTRHDNVKRTIETLADKGLVTLPQFEEISNPGSGPRTITVYSLNERDSYVVVARLSPEFTAALVDYWQANKKTSPVALPDFNNPAIAARAWAEQFEQREAAQSLADKRKEVIESQKPHVAFSTALLASDKSTSLAETAQLMNSAFRKFGRNTLVQQLLNDYYLTREGSQRRLRPSQYALDRNLFELKSTEFVSDDGAVLINHQVFITPKGLAHFIDRYVTKPKAEQAAELKREKEQRTGGLFKRQAA
jgi:phage antirepressor YoqD-like protein